MDYKQKYEDALEKAKYIYNDDPNSGTARAVCEQIFPELKESEDDKLIKEIISIVKSYRESCITEGNHRFDDCIAWLEKQGRVKHTCRNCQTFQDLHQNCPYSPIYQCTDLTEAHKHLDDETLCEFWLEKQSEQKVDKCKDCNNVKGCIICTDGDQYAHITEQKSTAWSEEDESMYIRTLGILGKCYVGELPTKVEEELNWLKSLKERVK